MRRKVWVLQWKREVREVRTQGRSLILFSSHSDSTTAVHLCEPNSRQRTYVGASGSQRYRVLFNLLSVELRMWSERCAKVSGKTNLGAEEMTGVATFLIFCDLLAEHFMSFVNYHSIYPRLRRPHTWFLWPLINFGPDDPCRSAKKQNNIFS